MKNKIIIILFFLSNIAFSQIKIGNKIKIDYKNPKVYEIGNINIIGAKHFDSNIIKSISGLNVGDKITIPGDDISKSIQNLWKQKLFSDISIEIADIKKNIVFLNIIIKERPRLSKFQLKGIKKSEADDIREQIKLIRGKIVTENLISEIKSKIKKYFIDKGFYNVKVEVKSIPDTLLTNNIILNININKGEKIKINEINFYGNNNLKAGKLRRVMKNTKRKRWYNIFTTSKFIEEDYESDKQNIIKKYHNYGFRDAIIIKDSVYRFDNKSFNIDIYIDEGKKYYIRKITWVGNTKYTSQQLNKILGIKKGDVYNDEELNRRLFMNPNGTDISSLYMDNGYLFFSITPVEVNVVGDSIDLEMRIYEGKQARINKVSIIGNTKTNDKVIMREIRTLPGELFRRSDIIRTQRELAQLGYFDPEKLAVNPKPHPEDGTVDIEYRVEEKPSDQIELSGGWGAGRIVGTLGLSFTNFASSKIFKKGAWTPLPSGDGQRLTLRAQSNGLYFQSYNFSFTEPWMGGRKPNSFTIAAYNSIQSNGETRYLKTDTGKILNPVRQSISIIGVSIGLGKRLKWPDDYFTLYQEINYQFYKLNNYQFLPIFTDGRANNISYTFSLSRNSIDQPIYPRRGSQITLSLKFTPPFSFFDDIDDYTELAPQEKYRWIEFHKWKFNSQWFTKLAGNLVLMNKATFGLLGMYNKNLGVAPFERFYMGGDGLTGFNLDDRELIRLRGYPSNSLSPQTGASIATKYTMELRYPVSLNPQATIFGLAFLEAGNSWDNFKKFSPFKVKRSAGVGVRIFLPMFGLFGVDWGYRFDNSDYSKSVIKGKGEFVFTIGASLNGW